MLNRVVSAIAYFACGVIIGFAYAEGEPQTDVLVTAFDLNVAGKAFALTRLREGNATEGVCALESDLERSADRLADMVRRPELHLLEVSRSELAIYEEYRATFADELSQCVGGRTSE
jgi:hypothetical protein